MSPRGDWFSAGVPEDGGEIFQPVRMTDGGGLVWLALYKMEKQKSGV